MLNKKEMERYDEIVEDMNILLERHGKIEKEMHELSPLTEPKAIKKLNQELEIVNELLQQLKNESDELLDRAFKEEKKMTIDEADEIVKELKEVTKELQLVRGDIHQIVTGRQLVNDIQVLDKLHEAYSILIEKSDKLWDEQIKLKGILRNEGIDVEEIIEGVK